METAIKRNKKPVRCRPSRATLTCKFFARLLFFCLFFFAFFKGKQQRKKSETKRKYVKGPFRSRSIAALGGSVAQLIMERGSTGVHGGPRGSAGGPPGVRRAQSVGVFFLLRRRALCGRPHHGLGVHGGPRGSAGGPQGPIGGRSFFFFLVLMRREIDRRRKKKTAARNSVTTKKVIIIILIINKKKPGNVPRKPLSSPTGFSIRFLYFSRSYRK